MKPMRGHSQDSAMNSNMRLMRKDLNVTKADVRFIRTDLNATQEDVRLIREDLNEVKVQVSDLQGNVRRLNVGFARLEGRFSELDSKFDLFMKKLDSVAVIQSAMDTMNRRFEIFLSQSLSQGSMLMEHERRIRTLESRPQ